jgi:asparagine synthase (glutamine-hydrolysing)
MIVCVPIKVWGIEGRVPFLTKSSWMWRINPQDKMINKEHPMEKWVGCKHSKIYTKCSVEAKKRQFSDGVGYSWIDTLKEVVVEVWTNNWHANISFVQTPTSRRNITIVLF